MLSGLCPGDRRALQTCSGLGPGVPADIQIGQSKLKCLCCEVTSELSFLGEKLSSCHASGSFQIYPSD